MIKVRIYELCPTVCLQDRHMCLERKTKGFSSNNLKIIF